ncbi:MAG: endo-1,4-beta-xylanase [Mongoliibacter sp.]|uniref:endo-1,4-beta-xylanase n=1 Tax=Mongoliibacter sp. TaxID=2022438 RepID=UPI0012F21249|nr:endo-1,4-beta-xylanase [Mongoliibacter sp.]TVP52073.1 MAG: endo-1,4-beta-xylanase [Mongoliibacter sp.]
MKFLIYPYLAILLSLPSMNGHGTNEKNPEQNNQSESLSAAATGHFRIGTALNERQLMGETNKSLELTKKHFNAIVAENCMKSGRIQPEEGQFVWEHADRFVEFGEKHGMEINGHTLIWHSQAPKWFFVDEDGNDVSKEVLIERMTTHINTLVGRYKGRVHTWDVVNETILDDGSWRNSKFYQILGEDFVKIAFELAHQADPEARLFYNDYSMAMPGKRAGVVAMVKRLQEQGVKIDGIGMQGHVGLDYPSLEEFEKSIKAFSDLGVEVMITEMDVSALPNPNNHQGAEISDSIEYQQMLNPYTDGLPQEVQEAFNERYMDFFRLFLKYKNEISRVTFWGVTDRYSWKNNFPVRGRTDYPLLFDRDYQPKAVVSDIIELMENYKTTN